MAHKVSSLADLEHLSPEALAQIQAALSPAPSDPAPVRKSATEALREQQAAILARSAQRPATTSAPVASDPPTAKATEATSTPATPVDVDHVVFAALKLSKIAYGDPKVSYIDQGHKVRVQLEGGLALTVDLRLQVAWYTAGKQTGPRRPVPALTAYERKVLTGIVYGRLKVR